MNSRWLTMAYSLLKWRSLSGQCSPCCKISTVSVPTSSGMVPTASLIFTTASVVTPYSRRKGKEKMVESDTPKKKRLQEQIDVQIAREMEEQLAKEDQRTNEQNEYEQFAADLSIEERIELINDLVKYQDNYAKVLKYQSQQRKPFSKKQQREFYMLVLKSHSGWKTKHFKGMSLEEIREKFIPVWKQIEDFFPIGSKEERERFKRKGLRLKHDSAKKVKTSKEVSEEDLKTMMQLVPVEEHFDREDLNQLWTLVKDTLSIRQATSDKEKELWVELKRLYEPDVEDQLWTHTQDLMHDLVEWRLYDTCGVHHVLSRDQEIFMLVERDYPLRKGPAIGRIVENKMLKAFPLPVMSSHIRQFWSTARVETSDEGTKILATVDATNRVYNISKMIFDGMVQNVNNKVSKFLMRARIAQSLALLTAADEPASPLRDDSQGEACLTVSSLESKHGRANIIKSSTLAHDLTPRVTSLAADEGSMQQQINDLTDLCTCLQRQQTEIASKITAQDLEIASLKARIKLLEDKDRGCDEPSGEDAIINGRSLEKGEEAGVDKSIKRGSNDTEELVNVLASLDAANNLTSRGVQVVSVSPATQVSTVSVPTSSELDTPKKKRLQEQIDVQMAREIEEQLAKKDQIMNEHIARDAKIARIHAEEELWMLIDSLDRNNETVAKYLQEYEQFAADLSIRERIDLINDLVKYQDNYAKVLKYQSQQRKPLSKKQQIEFYMSVLKIHSGWKTKHFKGMLLEEIREKFIPVWKQIEDFVTMGSKEEGERFKIKWLRLEKDSAKKRMIVGNKMVKAFPLPVMSSYCQKSFPLLVKKGSPTEFWSTATLKVPELGPPAILATINKTLYTITEELGNGNPMPLLPAMLLQAQSGEGAEVATQDIPHPVPDLDQSRAPLPTPSRPQTSYLVAPVLEHDHSSDPHDTVTGPFLFKEDAPLGGAFHTSPPRSSHAPPAGQPSGGEKDPITLTAFSSVVSSLVQKVHSLEAELHDHKKLFKDVVGNDSDHEDGTTQNVDLNALRALANAAVAADSDIPSGSTLQIPAASPSVPNTGPFDTSGVPPATFSIPLGASDAPPGASTDLPSASNVSTTASAISADSLNVLAIAPADSPNVPAGVYNKGEEAAKRLHEEEMAQMERERAEAQRKRQQEVLDSTMYYNESDWLNIRAQVEANASLSKTLLGPVLEEPSTKRLKSPNATTPSMPEVPISPAVTSPSSSRTSRKSLGRKHMHKPKSTFPTVDLDAPAQTFLKVVVDEDSDDEIWSAVVGWEVLPTPLGEINALYRIDGTTKHFDTLCHILHRVDRQDLMKLYGLVVKYYEHHPATGAGLLF
nr:hypothetical protein [Tanacetum cinerariifolium]GEY43006.1 hypothetical protein [Tanacetum cinerariifolium]